jgi:glyoxylase-like metal-dependent hydrolase (beta-lactamase superfamily II)
METFADRRTVTIDGQRAELTALPPSHTDGDAFVFFPAANVLIMGDLHHSNEYPVYDADTGCRCGSYEGSLQAYDAMLAAGNDRTIYIPGHGGPTTRAEVTAYVGMLRRIRDQVGTLIADGRTADEVVAMKLLAADRSPTTPGPDNRDQFVRTLYGALKTGQGR